MYFVLDKTSSTELVIIGFHYLNDTNSNVNKRINLPLFSTVVPAIIIAGMMVENKGKLIITEIFPSVQNMIFFSIVNKRRVKEISYANT